MNKTARKLIKIAYQNPSLRERILPVAKKAQEGSENQNQEEGGQKEDLPEPGTKEYMLTEKGADPKKIIGEWDKEEAKSLAKEYIGKFGDPAITERDQLTWFNVNDEVKGTEWDQLIVRDMADQHLDHKDSVFASKHLDIPKEAKKDVMRVEGVIATPGTHVVLVCGSTSGLNTILNWVNKQAEPYLGGGGQEDQEGEQGAEEGE